MNPGRLLRYARRAAGLSQRELGERTGVAQPTIARIEGDRASPRMATLAALLRACGWRLVLEPAAGIGVDRTAIRDLLRLSPVQRLQHATVEARNLAALTAERRRADGAGD